MKRNHQRFVYYFIGVAIGCFLLMAFPRPFKLKEKKSVVSAEQNKQTEKEDDDKDYSED